MLVSLGVYVKVCALGTHRWVVVGDLDEDVVHVVERALDGQGAQHAFREGEARAIDACTALCVC